MNSRFEKTYFTVSAILGEVIFYVGSSFIAGLILGLIFKSPWSVGKQGYDLAWCLILGGSFMLVTKAIGTINAIVKSNREAIEVACEQSSNIERWIKELNVDTPIDFCAVVFVLSHYTKRRFLLPPVQKEVIRLIPSSEENSKGFSLDTTLYDLFFDKFGRMPLGSEECPYWFYYLANEAAYQHGKDIDDITPEEICNSISPEIMKFFMEGVPL